MTAFSKYIVANADDGYQYSTAIDAGQNFLSFGQEGSYTFNTYLRFTNVTIPQGSVISSAKLELVARSTLSGTTCSVRIRCEDADNAGQISSYSDYSGRAITDAYTDWTVSAMDAGTTYDSADFKIALQEVVNRAGWASGNAIHVFIRDNGSSANAVRYAAALENSTYTEPRLVVEYADAVEADLSDSAGASDSADAFSLTDGFSDAAGIGDSVDAYNATAEPIIDIAGVADTADANQEVSLAISDAAGIGDTADAGFEAEGEQSDSAGFNDSSDGFNYTAWDAANRDRAVVRYYCTLTGAPDGLSDLTIPISSFQATKRTGESTYLSVVVPGITESNRCGRKYCAQSLSKSTRSTAHAGGQ